MTRFFAAALFLLVPGGLTQAADPAGAEFFEKSIRPLLVDHCYSCHSAKAAKLKGGLRLDGRDWMLKGGDTGPAIVPGRADQSRLIQAIGYGDVQLQMPPKAKLSDAAIRDLTAWVNAGAPWPKESLTDSKAEAAFDLTARRSSHWCWQPIKSPTPPKVKQTTWPRTSSDQFILAKLESAGLTPSPPAELRQLIRRLNFDLIGLPPTIAEVESTIEAANGDRRVAIENHVDRLLASPRFGERWARHWLDLMRYSETRGHEFDYPHPNAWQYRDYVIRALNNDVPYDQFVREHIAGDLLPQPRRHPEHGFNESSLATGFWWFGEQVQSPVDLKQDEGDRFDNAIDVFGKAFLGLTVACARCHDHKFDAISTRDYYALHSVLASSGYRQARFETDLQHRQVAEQLWKLREREQTRLRREVGKFLLETTGDMVGPYPEMTAPKPRPNATLLFDFGQCQPEDWRPDGVGFGPGPTKIGELRLGMVSGRPPLSVVFEPAAEADPAWEEVKVTAKTERETGDLHPIRSGRTIRTPSFVLDGRKLYYRVRGQGIVYAAVHHHHMTEGPLHRKLVLKLDAGDDFRWIEHDLSRYPGHRVHFEFTATAPNFAVNQVVAANDKPHDPKLVGPVDIRSAIQRWAASEQLTATEAAAIHALVRQHDEATCDRLGKIVRLVVVEIRSWMQSTEMESRLAPAMYDGAGVDGRVYIRGNPKTPGEVVPRRFLEALVGSKSLPGPGSGRLELARQVTDPNQNPLIARVFVNRVWHHLFWAGIVPSVDNFGVLGEAPTHPELLDDLADRFVKEGWSVKKLIRELVLSQTYQQSSVTRTDATTIDPQNKLVHRANVKRLEGETIRDTLLQLSGRFDATMYGPPVPIHLTAFMDGRGRPAKNGPLDGAGRRSIYLEVRRNFLPPLLTTFDTPTPFSTVGRRTVSNVPAQALSLLNDPYVVEQSKRWSDRVTAKFADDDERHDQLFREAFARPPSADERQTCRDFLQTHDWPALAHALVNLKQFIYIE